MYYASLIVLSSCSENGFEEGLSLLGLVSGLFNAMWSLGYVCSHLYIGYGVWLFFRCCVKTC